MTEERLLQLLTERLRPQTFAGLAKHFCVSEASISRALNRLEEKGHVKHELRHGKKFWSPTAERPQSAPRPKADPVALSNSGRVVTNRIARPGEEAPTSKRRTESPPPRQQSWFSAIEK